MLSARSDLLRASVFRIFSADDPSELLGTAFGVSPDFIVTCAHVIKDRSEGSVRFLGNQGDVGAVKFYIHPDAEHKDLALVQTEQKIQHLLPMSAQIPNISGLTARGYLPEDVGWGGRELHFSSRGKTNVKYEGGTSPFSIDDSFDLAGDIASPGLSGSPLLETSSGAVFGVICGGNPVRSRSWAVLFQDHSWPLFQEIIEWNEVNLPRFGSVLNGVGALQACKVQLSMQIELLNRSRKYIEAWNVPRSDCDETVKSFLSSTLPIMAIVGDANVGKTWFLANLSLRSTDRAVILLFGATLRDVGSTSFDVFVDKALSGAWCSNAGDGLIRSPTLREIALLFNDKSCAPLILLDGLNEAENDAALFRQWIPNAIGICRDWGIKMIITSRTESWPTILRSIPNVPPCLYRQRSSNALNQLDAYSELHQRAEDESPRLGEFTRTEVATAKRVYGIALPAETLLGSHPFMFRIASELHLQELDASVGSYRLLKNFLLRQLDDVVSRVRGSTVRSLWLRLERIASSWASGISSGFTWVEAASEFGSDEIVNALSDAGVFVVFGNIVRFAYDQIGEMLAPIVCPPIDIFANILLDGASADREAERSIISRACVDMLKIEAEGNEAEFVGAVQSLFRALEAIAGRVSDEQSEDLAIPLVAGAMRLISGLPKRRGDIIRELCSCIILYRDLLAEREYFEPDLGALCKCIEDAPLSMEARADIVISLVPWDNAWPWRIKDWEDESRFPSFVDAVDDLESGRPGTVLNRLFRTDPGVVRPILVAGLANETKINKGPREDSRGEATISSLCAGLLFHAYWDAPTETWHALGETSQTPATCRLVSALAKRDPFRAKAVASTWLHDALKIDNVGTILETLRDSFNHNDKAAIVNVFHQVLAEEGDTPHSARAARIARSIEENDVESWDWLVTNYRKHFSRYDWRCLVPVPGNRLASAIEFAQRDPEIGLSLAGDADGPLDEQAIWARYVEALWESRRKDEYNFGSVAEMKANKLKKDPRYAPWRTLILAIASSQSDSARRYLIYSAFDESDDLSDITKEMRVALISNLFSKHEAKLIIDKITNWRDKWWEIWIALRKVSRAWADRGILIKISIKFSERSESESNVGLNTTRRRLITFWTGLPADEQTEISKSIVQAIRAGEPLTKILLFSAVVDLLNRVDDISNEDS